ncbi:Uncharacterised protein [uncultured archaeon]|nr:Uncharacterised protein [uncultured archaeon]
MKTENIIPKKTVRRYLKNRLQGDVSEKAVAHLRQTIQTTLDDFCIEATKKHDEQNRLRKNLGLKEKKRFDKELFIKVSPRFITNGTLPKSGESGQVNEETLSSGSNDFMETKNKSSCSKSAGVDAQ